MLKILSAIFAFVFSAALYAAQTNPFALTGKTQGFTAAASAPTPVQVGNDASVSPQNYVVYNSGAVDIALFFGVTAAAATANATGYPTVGGGSNGVLGIVIPSKAIYSISAPPSAFFTGISASSTAVVWVAPGEGQ